VIPSDPDDDQRVVGLTVINDQLFVLRHPSKDEIQVYETETFTRGRTVRVVGLEEGWRWCKALTSCAKNNCLYVCDTDDVYKVNLSTDNVTAIHWRVDGYPYGLSVNKESNLIVTCWEGNELREYTTDGKSLVRRIKLQESDISWPWQAAQMDDGQYVVCHDKPRQGLSVVDKRGQLLATYRNGESDKLLSYPQCLAVTSVGILVADCCNDRIVALNCDLSDARDLPLACDASALKELICLYFDESKCRLYVGKQHENSVLIFDNVGNVLADRLRDL